MNHSELPWHTGIGCPEGVHTEDGKLVCDCDCGEPNKTILANAAFIVKAVNEREGLFELLNLIRDDLRMRSDEEGVVNVSGFIWDRLNETISHAEKEDIE